MTYVITHRGIDAEHHHSFTESSIQAFDFFLRNGFGVEFDVQITRDHTPVISHDPSLARISGQPVMPITEMSTADFLSTSLPNGNTTSLQSLLVLASQITPNQRKVNALHIKHSNQTAESIDCILDVLDQSPIDSLMLFDVKPAWAKYIKTRMPALKISASVAHPYDIDRYNHVVGGTLHTIDEIIDHKQYYDCAWLDEWDTADKDGGTKKLYTSEIIDQLHNEGLKVAVVSPELHATSPKLLGGECHSDGKNLVDLERRWEEIFRLKPDAICTDYPFTLESY